MPILLPSEGKDWLPALLGEWHYLAGTSNQLCLWCLAFKLLEIVGKEGHSEDTWKSFGWDLDTSFFLHLDFVVWLAGWRLWIPLWIALVLCFLLSNSRYAFSKWFEVEETEENPLIVWERERDCVPTCTEIPKSAGWFWFWNSSNEQLDRVSFKILKSKLLSSRTFSIAAGPFLQSWRP